MATKSTSNNNVELGVSLSQESINNLNIGLKKVQAMFTGAFTHLGNVVSKLQSSIDNTSGNSTKDSSENEIKRLQDQYNTYASRIDVLTQKYEGYQERIKNNIGNQERNERGILDTTAALAKEKARLIATEAQLLKYGITAKDTAKKIEDSGEKIEKQNNETKKSNKELSESFDLVNYTAIGMFRKILRFGTRAFAALTTAGSDYMEINSRFNRILGEGADVAEESARRIADAYGRDLTEVKGYFTDIYTILKNSNLEISTAIGLSANLTAIANDLASVWDTDVDQAVNAVISGLQGLPKAMKRYGVYLTQSEIKEYLVEAGFIAEDYAGKLGSGERALATYVKIMKDSGYAIHDFANTQSSVANQTRILNSTFTSLKRSLGNMMNSVLSPLLQVFNYVLKVVSSLVNELNSLPEPLKFIIGLFTTLITITPIAVGGFMLLSYFGKVWRRELARIAEATKGATGANLLFNKSLLWIASNWKKVMLWGTIFMLFLTSLVGIVNDLTKSEEENEDALKNSKDAAKDYMRALAGFDDVNVLSFNDKQESSVLNFENVGDITSLENTFDELVGKINDVADSMGAWKWVILGISSALLGLKLINSWDKINEILIKLIVKFKGLKGSITTTTAEAKKFTNVFDTAKKKQMSFGQVFAATGVAILAVGYAFQQVTSIWNSQQPLWTKIIRTILAATTAVAGLAAAWYILKGKWLGAGIAAGVALGAVAGNIGLSYIPEQQLATGGVAVGATRAVIGEGIYDEAVIPLGQSPQFDGMKSDIASAVVEGLAGANISNGQPINITINVDEDYIYKAYNRQAKLYGRSL